MSSYNTTTSFITPISYAMILAVDNRGGIGLNNDLPWKGIVSNKSDMEWFKEKTKGKVVIMGYNTWVSIGRKPLPGRVNIIISDKRRDIAKADINVFMSEWLDNSNNQGKDRPTVLLGPSPEAAKSAIEAGVGNFHNGGEVMVIGGAQIYQAFMEHASRIYLTTFDGEFEADTFVKLDLTGFDLRYRDTMKLFEPKFEIWDVTKELEGKPDSEIMQISYGHKPKVD